MADRKKQNIYPEQDPAGSIQLAAEHLKSQMPEESKGASIRPFSLLDSMITPKGVAAATDMFGNIVVDPQLFNLLGGDQSLMDDVLAHELTHVGQKQKRGFWGNLSDTIKQSAMPYMERPKEKEAYAVEATRQSRRRDIELPAERRKK